MRIQLKEWMFPFLQKEQVAKDAYAFSFDTSASEFNFLAGQYIRIFLPHQNPDERGIQRLFSIAKSPLEKGTLRIVTRILKSTFKKHLLELTPRTQVKFFGPMGQFVFKDEETQPHIFLAGGIGITPYLSMIPYIAEKNLSTKVTLFVSFSTVEDVIYYDKLNEVSKEHPNIKLVFTVTKPEESQKPWNGETGRISEDLIKKYAPDYSSSLFYISGPPAMVLAMEEMVKGMQIPQEKIRKEQFTGY